MKHVITSIENSVNELDFKNFSINEMSLKHSGRALFAIESDALNNELRLSLEGTKHNSFKLQVTRFSGSIVAFKEYSEQPKGLPLVGTIDVNSLNLGIYKIYFLFGDCSYGVVEVEKSTEK